jgi:hypothetical protein
MPYDPRPVSEGGNRSFGETLNGIAPQGKFRVIAVDTFDGSDWLQGDYNSLDEAKTIAKKHGGTMLKMHVYDDRGAHKFEAGEW